MKIIYAPDTLPETILPMLFTAGSIDMGTAPDWQQHFAEQLIKHEGYILNPRRPDWDSTWEQKADSKPFREQVLWELNALEAATHIALYFSPDSKAPISLLELGLFAGSGKLKVCCPEGFWRKGNVDIVCDKFGIPQFKTLNELITAFKEELL